VEHSEIDNFGNFTKSQVIWNAGGRRGSNGLYLRFPSTLASLNHPKADILTTYNLSRQCKSYHSCKTRREIGKGCKLASGVGRIGPTKGIFCFFRHINDEKSFSMYFYPVGDKSIMSLEHSIHLRIDDIYRICRGTKLADLVLSADEKHLNATCPQEDIGWHAPEIGNTKLIGRETFNFLRGNIENTPKPLRKVSLDKRHNANGIFLGRMQLVWHEISRCVLLHCKWQHPFEEEESIVLNGATKKRKDVIPCLCSSLVHKDTMTLHKDKIQLAGLLCVL